MKNLVLLVFCFIFLLIGVLIRKLGKPPVEVGSGNGEIIDKIYDSDNAANVYYVIRCEDHGNILEGRSIYYSSDTKSLEIGEEVPVGWYFTEKQHRPKFVIHDDRIRPVSGYMNRGSIGAWIIAAGFLAAFIISNVRK